MVTCSMDLPVNIPWKLIAASPDMMDTRFCDKLFPFAWRSSLAISAYEPSPEDLPDNLCEGRITYLKITCTITGYQPSKEETGQIVSFFDQPTEDQRAAIDRILAEYFACYGVLLNVAVFPPRETWKKLSDVTVDFSKIQDTTPGALLPNPYQNGGVKFQCTDSTTNQIVDICPQGGDGQGELDITTKLIITFPPALKIEKVEAKVCHFSPSGVKMEAFKGGVSVGSQAAGPQQYTTQSLSIESEGLDQVVLTAPDKKASLLEFSYSVIVDEGTTDPTNMDLNDYPHIIDFEPKVRDLYQAATETGEVLSDSKSGIKTDKSFTHTDSTQNSFSLGSKVSMPIPGTPAVGELSGSTTHTSTDTDQSQWAVQVDASRERRETQSTSTQISQMYNLLTGYHIGTNRAVFLMLARPHVLQPTDFRTFVQGLRAIEGVQEFFLIVARPEDMEGLCVEAFLETGHFPEDTPIVQPAPQYDENIEDFVVTKTASSGLFSQECKPIDTTYTIADGWVIDRSPLRRPDPGHPGMRMLEDRSNGQANGSLQNYNYFPSSDSSVNVQGTICGSRAPWADDAKFDRTYRVFTRSDKPKPSEQQPSADVGRLIITNRGLCVCFKSGDCPEVLPPPEQDGGIIYSLTDKVIVDEPVIRISPALITGMVGSVPRTPAMKAFLRQVERSMANSWRLPGRYPLGKVGFLESEHFKEQIKNVLPKDYLGTPVGAVGDLPENVVRSLGKESTVGDVLSLNLASLASNTGMSVEEAGKLRQQLLRPSAKTSKVKK